MKTKILSEKVMVKRTKKPAIPRKYNKGRRPKIAQISLKMELSSIPRARETLARFMKAYDANQISSAKLRDLNTTFRTLLSYQIAERDADLEIRLTALEEKIEGIINPKRLEILK